MSDPITELAAAARGKSYEEAQRFASMVRKVSDDKLRWVTFGTDGWGLFRLVGNARDSKLEFIRIVSSEVEADKFIDGTFRP